MLNDKLICYKFSVLSTHVGSDLWIDLILSINFYICTWIKGELHRYKLHEANLHIKDPLLALNLHLSINNLQFTFSKLAVVKLGNLFYLEILIYY